MQFAKSIANEVVFMDTGEIVAVGTPTDIFENPKEARLRNFLNRVEKS